MTTLNILSPEALAVEELSPPEQAVRARVIEAAIRAASHLRKGFFIGYRSFFVVFLLWLYGERSVGSGSLRENK